MPLPASSRPEPFTADAKKEIVRFRKQTGKVICPLTVREILDEEIEEELAQKLA